MKRRNFKGVASIVLVLLFLGVAVMLLTGFMKYPEKYLSTWRYQLKCDIEQGDEAAIDYYQTNYVANGIYLFGDE